MNEQKLLQDQLSIAHATIAVKDEALKSLNHNHPHKCDCVVCVALTNSPAEAQRLVEDNRRMKIACESSLAEFRALMGYLHSHNMISPQTRMVINQLKEALSTTPQPDKEK